ncbi:KPN_01571 family protein [Vagococcus sp. WN89Y]|uniref:KPN_01571 family protein n=1 Tax=Vagococcus sp. WN89Y TaxID=3457258 RepID=UPI003FCE449B
MLLKCDLSHALLNRSVSITKTLQASIMNPFIWVIFALLVMDAAREFIGAASIGAMF